MLLPPKGSFTLLHFQHASVQMVALLQGDRKFPISALTQPIAENADHCVKCESALRLIHTTCI